MLEKDLQIKTSELFFKLLNLYQCVYNQSVPCPSIQILLNQYESCNFGKKISRNKATIQIFWKQVYESNPRNKSFRFGFASPPAWIFKDSGFANLYSTNDLWRFVRICWIREIPYIWLGGPDKNFFGYIDTLFWSHRSVFSRRVNSTQQFGQEFLTVWSRFLNIFVKSSQQFGRDFLTGVLAGWLRLDSLLLLLLPIFYLSILACMLATF